MGCTIETTEGIINTGQEWLVSTSGPTITDLINQEPPLSKSKLRHVLLHASPLSPDVLNVVINKKNAMVSSDYKAVRFDN